MYNRLRSRGKPGKLTTFTEFSERRCCVISPAVRPGVKEHHLCRFDEQRPHRRGRGEKLYRSFYMQ